MQVHYTLSHYDRRHRLVGKTPPEPSRSFVKAFLQLLYVEMADLTQNIIDITNTSKTIADAQRASLSVAHPGLDAKDDFFLFDNFQRGTDFPYNVFSDGKGIIVGTSNTAVAVADDNLVAPIAHGTSAGQFVYYGCWGLNYTTGASSASFDVERIFKNSSGGSITVAEIGMYCTATNAINPVSTEVFSFCLLRDVISPTVAVLNGEYLKVKYTVTVSV